MRNFKFVKIFTSIINDEGSENNTPAVESNQGTTSITNVNLNVEYEVDSSDYGEENARKINNEPRPKRQIK